MSNYKIENWTTPQLPGQAGVKITWIGTGVQGTTQAVYGGGDQTYYYGGMASSDPNTPVGGWTEWSNYGSGGRHNSARFIAPLNTPLYVLPRYIKPAEVSSNAWQAYDLITISADGSQITCSKTSDPTAGITISIMGGGGGGPEEGA